MKRNGKLSLALHALGHLARADAPMTSDAIAAHCRTNPVVVRRTLGPLRDAGIVAAEKGHSGGWTLARPAARITLAEVHVALGDPLVPQVSTQDPPSGCAIERMLTDLVGTALSEAETLLVGRLARATLADLAGAQGHG